MYYLFTISVFMAMLFSHSFVSSSAVNTEEGFLDCMSVMAISFFFCFCFPPFPMSFLADKKFLHVAYHLTNSGVLRSGCGGCEPTKAEFLGFLNLF